MADSFPSPSGTGDPSSKNLEGGLRAPSHLRGWRKWWWWFDFVVLVNLARLRFIAILVLVGVLITKWEVIVSYYEKWTRKGAESAAVSGDFEWFCPMHPVIVRDNPKEKCPICFMPLSKRKMGAGSAPLPPGTVSRVQLTPYRVVLAGIQTWEVHYIPLSKEITAVGYIEFNERLQRSITARFGGRIDELIVSETGRMVQTGEELASIYSPELVVATQSLLDAKKSGNEPLHTGTQTRLRLLGISDDQIAEIVNSGKSTTHLKIRSPIKGHVIRKYIREGQYVQEGMPLFDVADLSSVWIQAQVYEDDLLFLPEELSHSDGEILKNTLPITATTSSIPNEEFHGMLTFVYPHVDQQTRTVTVRFELDNPDHKLRPGSTARVTLKVPLERWALLTGLKDPDDAQHEHLKRSELLAIPESAVIDTGTQKVVYREAEPGVFEGVTVKLGPKMSGPDGVFFFPILEGLKPGTRVVAAGSFLVDAETRLNPSSGSIYIGGGTSRAKGGSTTVRPSTPEDSDAKFRSALERLSPADRAVVDSQRFCPVLPQNRLGSMGTPVKVLVGGEPVFLCCSGCQDKALSSPNATLAKVKELRTANSGTSNPTPSSPENGTTSKTPEAAAEAKIATALAKLDPADRQAAEKQRMCVVLDNRRLGSMGAPVKVTINGQDVFVCCASCRQAALKNPEKTLSKHSELTGDKP